MGAIRKERKKLEKSVTADPEKRIEVVNSPEVAAADDRIAERIEEEGITCATKIGQTRRRKGMVTLSLLDQNIVKTGAEATNRSKGSRKGYGEGSCAEEEVERSQNYSFAGHKPV